MRSVISHTVHTAGLHLGNCEVSLFRSSRSYKNLAPWADLESNQPPNEKLTKMTHTGTCLCGQTKVEIRGESPKDQVRVPTTSQPHSSGMLALICVIGLIRLSVTVPIAERLLEVLSERSSS